MWLRIILGKDQKSFRFFFKTSFECQVVKRSKKYQTSQALLICLLYLWLVSLFLYYAHAFYVIRETLSYKIGIFSNNYH